MESNPLWWFFVAILASLGPMFDPLEQRSAVVVPGFLSLTIIASAVLWISMWIGVQQ